MNIKVPFSMRQGDVLVLEAAYVGGMPAHLEDVTPKTGRIVLQHGESTGHAHAFYDNTYNIKLQAAHGGQRYVHLQAATALKHEEHDAPTVPANDYVLPGQYEYAPAELVRVKD